MRWCYHLTTFIHCANHGELTRSSSEENANYWSVNCSLKEISSLEQMNYFASVSGKIEENLKWMITAFSNICLMYDQSKLDGISFQAPSRCLWNEYPYWIPNVRSVKVSRYFILGQMSIELKPGLDVINMVGRKLMVFR